DGHSCISLLEAANRRRVLLVLVCVAAGFPARRRRRLLQRPCHRPPPAQATAWQDVRSAGRSGPRARRRRALGAESRSFQPGTRRARRFSRERPRRSALGQVAGLLGRDEQLVLRIDEGVALVVRELVVLLEVDRVLGAGFLAVAAEDAAEHVDLVALGVALPVRDRLVRIVLGGLHEDRVGRAGDRAQLATDAALEAGLVAGGEVVGPGARARPPILFSVTV